jgi:hypothetical protein
MIFELSIVDSTEATGFFLSRFVSGLLAYLGVNKFLS